MFRLVRGHADDWKSDYELQRQPRPPARANALIYMGLSMWSAMEDALEANGRCRPPFEDVAAVELRGEEGIWFARTFGPGHYTVWGRAEALQRCVVEIVSLR